MVMDDCLREIKKELAECDAMADRLLERSRVQDENIAVVKSQLEKCNQELIKLKADLRDNAARREWNDGYPVRREWDDGTPI